jgi:hypothetical protein
MKLFWRYKYDTIYKLRLLILESKFCKLKTCNFCTVKLKFCISYVMWRNLEQHEPYDVWIQCPVLFKEWIYLVWLVMDYHPKKQWQETASLRVVHDANVPLFFFPGDSSITNKTNKFIPYHLIIWKTQILWSKSCFIIFYCTIFYVAWVFCDVWAYTSQIHFFPVTQNHPNFWTNRKACYIENQMITISLHQTIRHLETDKCILQYETTDTLSLYPPCLIVGYSSKFKISQLVVSILSPSLLLCLKHF